MQASIQTPTNQLSNSQEFYQKLGYTLLSKEKHIYSDGKVLIVVNQDRLARVGINFYQSNWTVFKKNLPASITITDSQDTLIVSDPNGVLVYLNQGTLPTPSDTPPAIPGIFAGISIETIDINKTIAFWKLFGYEVAQGSIDQDWITLSNETGLDISCMKLGTCPHLFFNPSLTYFNGGNNLPVIQRIRATGIPIIEEITHFNKEGIVDNIIIRDPGGLGFFIFND